MSTSTSCPPNTRSTAPFYPSPDIVSSGRIGSNSSITALEVVRHQEASFDGHSWRLEYEKVPEEKDAASHRDELDGVFRAWNWCQILTLCLSFLFVPAASF